VSPEKNEESRGLLKGLNYKSGNLLQSKIFGNDPQYEKTTILLAPLTLQRVISMLNGTVTCSKSL